MVEVGRIVRSKAGRDKGRMLCIVEVIDDEYVMVADGGLRKLEKPKKKKCKHLQMTNRKLEEILSNSRLKSYLEVE